MNSADTLEFNGALHRKSSSSNNISFPARIINTLYRWQDSGKKDLGHNDTSYKDISPTRGDGQTDYAKPVWQR